MWCLYYIYYRFRNVSFEITATDVGVFEVTGRFLGRQIEKVELVFQVSVTVQSIPGNGSPFVFPQSKLLFSVDIIIWF